MLFEKDLFYKDSERLDTFVCIEYPECELEIGSVRGLGVQIEEIGLPHYLVDKIEGIIDSVNLLYDCGFTSQDEYCNQIFKVFNYIFYNYTLMKEGKPFHWRDHRHPEKKPFPLEVKVGGDGRKRVRLYVSRDVGPDQPDLYNFSDLKMISNVMVGKLYQPVPNSKFGYYLPYQDAVDLGWPKLDKGQQVKVRVTCEGVKVLVKVGEKEIEAGK